MINFKVGDRVIVNTHMEDFDGKIGTVIEIKQNSNKIKLDDMVLGKYEWHVTNRALQLLGSQNEVKMNDKSQSNTIGQIKDQTTNLRGLCTCGAKHTSNPLYHSAWCDSKC